MKVALPRSAQRTAIIYTDIYHAQKKNRIRTRYTVAYWAQRMYLILTNLSLNVLLSLPVTPIKNVVWIILQLPIGQLISYWKSKPRDQLVFRVQ